MRDPARIDRILEAIRARWKVTPDMRLGQLLCALSPKFDSAFYYEDDALEADLARLTRETKDQP